MTLTREQEVLLDLLRSPDRVMRTRLREALELHIRGNADAVAFAWGDYAFQFNAKSQTVWVSQSGDPFGEREQEETVALAMESLLVALSAEND